MKTAMEELLHDLKDANSGNNFIKTIINLIIDLVESKLEKEKNQIMDAFVAGSERGTKNIPFNCEQYYSQTFIDSNQAER